MTALTNARHERFALALVEGMTADGAYVAAGFKAHRQNAARLMTNDDVRRRVAELQARAAADTRISVAAITERLLSIAEKGEKDGAAPMLAVARAALMDAAKLNGLVVDKSQVALDLADVRDRPLTADEWSRQLPPA